MIFPKKPVAAKSASLKTAAACRSAGPPAAAKPAGRAPIGCPAAAPKPAKTLAAAISPAFILCLPALFPLSCAHLSPQQIESKIRRIPYYTRKSEVLDSLGSPFQIRRKRGLDRWIYKLKIGDYEYTRALVFKEGRFLRAEEQKPYPPVSPLLEEAENFEQYTKAAEYIKKQKRRKK